MKNRLIRLWKSRRAILNSQFNPSLERSCAGRLLNALTFIVVVICLGTWITAFLLLKDRLFTETLSGNILTNLTCLTFFGGLVISIFIGTLAGDFLRRTFWKWLILRRNK